MRTGRSVLGPLLCALLLLAACGGGGGGGAAAPADAGVGTVQFALTDAPSDAIDLFEVDVVSLALHGRDGSVVEALPRSQRVDLADLVSLSELLTVATVPAGVYDRFALTLDFTTAAVHLDGAAGLATLLDEDGNAFASPTRLPVVLPSDRPLVVTAGTSRFVELDFDLDASAVVDGTSNTVLLGAVLYARMEPSDAKPIRAYGRLTGTDVRAGTFTFEVMRRRETDRGPEHTAVTDATTHFEVDGRRARGGLGLALLAEKPEGTRLEVHGTLDPATHRLRARAVEAGRGVFDGTRDLVEGHVVRRTGGAGEDATLLVAGTGVDRRGAVDFHRTWTVSVAHADTRVVRRGDGSDLTTDDVNVGQRIVAFGDLSRPDGTLDATVAGEGLVRLLETAVAGTAHGPVASAVLEIDVATIGRIPVARFDFDVDGTTVADPSALAVGTEPLLLPRVGAGSAVVALGFFVPVTAPSAGPDFRALAVVDRTEAASVLRVGWGAGTSAPFAEAADTGVTVDLSSATFATVDVGLVAPTDLLGGADPRVVPAPEGVFAILERDQGETLHRDFGEWLSDLEGRLARTSGAVSVRGLAGLGRWDASARTLTARRLAAFVR